MHVLINADTFTEVTHLSLRMRMRSECFPQIEQITGVISLSLLAATSTCLSLVNEAQYLMINRASVELIQKLMSSRFELMMRYSEKNL